MQLVLERCTVRPWRLADAESLVRHANNRKVWLAVRDAFPHPYTIKDAHEFIRGATSQHPTTRFCIDIDRGRWRDRCSRRLGRASAHSDSGLLVGEEF